MFIPHLNDFIKNVCVLSSIVFMDAAIFVSMHSYFTFILDYFFFFFVAVTVNIFVQPTSIIAMRYFQQG